MNHSTYKILSLFWIFSVLVSFSPSVVLPQERADEVYSFAHQLKRDRLFEAAAQQFLQFATGNPRDPRAPDALDQAADCLSRAGSIDQAIQVLETLIQTYPNSVDLCGPKVRLGRLYFNKGRFTDADRVYNDVVALKTDCPLYPDALLGKGEALISLKKYNAAIDLFAAIVRDHLETQVAARAFFDLAFCQRQLNKNSDAIETYSVLVRTFPKNPMSAFASIEVAKMLVAGGDSLAAIDHYERARQFEEKVIFVPATLEGALILEGMGNHRRALEWYKEVLDLGDLSETETDPGDVYGRAARAAYRAGVYDSVFRFAGLFIERYEGAFSPELTYFQALAELKRSNYTRAIEEAGILETHAPGSEWAARASRIRGEALNAGGKPREAIGELRRFVSATPDSAAKCEVLEKIADVFLTALGDTVAALDVIQEKLEVQKRQFPRDLFLAGRVFERAGKYGKAEELYQEVLDAFPLSPEFEGAKTRLFLIREFTLLDPVEALSSLGDVAFEITTMERDAARLRLAEAKLEIIKDPEGALRILSEIKPSLKNSPLYPKALYLEGACNASRSRKAYLLGEDQAAGEAMKKAMDPWKELARRYTKSDWAAAAAMDRVLLEFSTVEELDTVEVFRILSLYPNHAGRAALLELLGDYYTEASSPGGMRRALIYYQQALNLKGGGSPELELKVAEALLSAKRYMDALNIYERLAGRREKRIRLKAAYGAGKALRWLKRYDEALSRFLDVERTTSGDMAARAGLQAADCRYMLKQYEKALSDYNRVAGITRDSNLLWEVGFRVGLCHRRLGFPRQALQAMEACIASPRGGGLRSRAYSHAMEIAREIGDWEKEKQLLAMFVEEYRDQDASIPAKRRLVRLHLSINDPASALALTEDLIRRESGPDNEDKALWIMSLYRSGKIKDADGQRAALEQKIGSASPLLGEITIEKAKYYYNAKEYNTAVEVVAGFAGACAGDSICEEALYLHSMSLIAGDRVEDGTRGAQRFFEKFPLSKFVPRLHLRLGNVLSIKFKRYNEALMHYREAAATAKDSSVVFDALKNTAVTYQTLSRWGEAGRVWAEMLDRFPRSPSAGDVSLNVARCKMESGNYVDAIAAYEEAIPILDDENRARAYYWLGICHQTLGDFQSAIVEYLKVPYLLPNEGMWAVTSQLKAAECYVSIGRYDAAREVYISVINRYGSGSNWGKVARNALDELSGSTPKEERGGEQEE